MLHGLIQINKSPGISSHAVVEEIRHIFKMKKVGHFGTLDPLASGLLLIGLGNATKFFDFYIKKKKVYSGKIIFGYSTTTYDAEGDPTTEKKEIDLNTIDIKALLSEFTGKQMQMPPIYSAKKFKGKPMYQYARENKEDQVDIKSVPVEVYTFKGNIVNQNTLWFRTETSSGTYIRSLAHDIGKRVGVGAYLDELVREGVGEFFLENAFSIEEIEKHVTEGNIGNVVTPIEILLPEFSKIIVTPGGRDSVLNGQHILPGDVAKIIPVENNENFRIFDDEGKLLAIACKDPKLIRFKPYIVFPN